MSLIRYTSLGLRRQIIAGNLPNWLRNMRRMKYVVACAISTPDWVDRKALRAIHREAEWKTRATGVPHTIGHIVPLTHPRVCGLTVPWNLRVQSGTENYSKGNGWCQWHGELFESPEQLRLFQGAA